MALVERLLSVFGAGDGGNATADGRHVPREEPRNQRHGSHWDTVLADDGNWDERVMSTVEHAVERGERVESHYEEISGVRFDDGPGTVWALVEAGSDYEGKMVSTYPGVEGTELTLSVHGLREWETGVEAWVMADLGPAAVSVFPTNFFQRDRSEFGGECEVSLAAMLYRGDRHDSGAVSLVGGESYELGPYAAMNEADTSAPDDYHFQTVVEDVARVSGDIFDGYLLDAPLFRREDVGVDVPGTLYLGSHVAGDYEPSAGDAIEGAGWLQARFR